uniref:Uncharacterized protein n=1 Tax=Ananas comosus var. bracteatus TaxID=296719 RepID=A0A6V7PXW7_ANACO|nr:unnamed protein product [Ananas comosus var. bracteatus]
MLSQDTYGNQSSTGRPGIRGGGGEAVAGDIQGGGEAVAGAHHGRRVPLSRARLRDGEEVAGDRGGGDEEGRSRPLRGLRAAGQIKTLASDIPSPDPPDPPIPSISAGSGSGSPAADDELKQFGVTEELREFVKGITISTFRDFPMEDEPEISEVPTVSNVRQDLSEWQARHATLVLSTVKIDLRRANNCEIILTKVKMPLPVRSSTCSSLLNLFRN